MTRPSLLVQLSDLHVGATWAPLADPLVGLASVIEAVLELPDPPDAVLVSGDLADNGTVAEYESALELLNLIGAPVYVLPGNHDDRATLRKVFDTPGEGAEPVQYTADIGFLRLIVMDSTRPGEDEGELDHSRLEWLNAALTAAPDRPTLIAMHHPPFATGIEAWDAVSLRGANRIALAEVVRAHSQVQCLVAGHLHCTIISGLEGRVALSIPSTYAQFRPTFQSQNIEIAVAPAGFAMHTLLGKRFATHIQPVQRPREATAGPA